MRFRFCFIIWCCCSFIIAQQTVDLDFPIEIKTPKYNLENGLRIGIDASHNNFHTMEGGFAPFAELLRADGYRLTSLNQIDEKVLKTIDILVIANALHVSNVGNWRRPISSAFSENDINTIINWVNNGGKLLLIADHMPFAGASNSLAEPFGFSYLDGFVMGVNETWPPETYSKQNGNLFETPVTKNIDSLAGFTGSALKIPSQAIGIASFPETHQVLIPIAAWQFNNETTHQPIKDFFMGAIMPYGKGKVAIFTEAAMFTAQIIQGRNRVGFNSPYAPQNMQFVLNVVHWLDGN